MALPDILELRELLLSWRFYAGLALACATCRPVLRIVSNDTIGWFFCVPVGIIGLGPVAAGKPAHSTDYENLRLPHDDVLHRSSKIP